MSDFFDSSVLVGVIFADCPEHADCFHAWKNSAERFVYSHGLLETFSQLTGGRLGTPIAPDVAAQLISRNVKQSRVHVVSLDPDELLENLEKTRHVGVRGGAIYDHMHLCAARKVEADRIFTLNKRHFMAIAPTLSLKILHPAECR